jgi:hypothetical protein
MQYYSNSGVVENKDIEQFLTSPNERAPSEGRYNKAAVRALPELLGEKLSITCRVNTQGRRK